MTIEQIIILILFVVIPVFQALRRKWDELREASLRTEDVEEPEIEPVPYSTPLPEWTAPVTPVQVDEIPIPPSTPAPSTSAPRRPEPPAPRSRRELARPAPLRRADLVPPDRDSLRRVMALMAIFGPPRSSDPYRT